MAITKQNNAEGGTGGTAVTTGNSGGTSGDAWNTVTGSGITYASSAASHGSLGYQFVCTSGASSRLQWTGFNDTIGVGRYYMKTLPSLPASDEALVAILTSTGSSIWSLILRSDGTYRVAAAPPLGGGNITTTATAAAGDRLKFAWTIGTTGSDGHLDLWVYRGDSGTAVEHISSTTMNFGTTNWDRVQFGKTSTSTWTPTFAMDDMAVTSGTTTPGFTDPVVTLNPPTASFTTSPVALTVNVDGSASTAVSPATITGYDWDWGDSTTHGSGSNPSHTYSAGGTYTITLTVTDSNSQTGSVSHTVTVAGPSPTGGFASISVATGATPSTGSGTSGVLTVLTDSDSSTYVELTNGGEIKGVAVALTPPAAGQPCLWTLQGVQCATAWDGSTANSATSATLTLKMYEGATLRSTAPAVTVPRPAVAPNGAPDPTAVVAGVFPAADCANVTSWNTVTFDLVAACS